MIPFASQRGEGQDLATHLANEQDNDRVEMVNLRGSIADDLHGAFREWEAQARNLTNCKNYLYSLSINPDPKQGPLTEDQYLLYLSKVEEKLGLSEQPRAVVRHVKYGREHFHAVYSRINAQEEKAVHLAFDKDKLMMVTREFAKSQGLQLPDGYRKHKEKQSRDQLSLYDKSQQETTGLTREERAKIVTECWQQSDSPTAFVAALEENGYLLATGKRPYLLVDIYGNITALPRLISDRSVKIKQIREFLEKEFKADDLPNVEKAKELIIQHYRQHQKIVESHRLQEQREILLFQQEERHEKLDRQALALKEEQAGYVSKLEKEYKTQLHRIRSRYLAATRVVKWSRLRNQPTGLAAFLGKISGVNLMRKKFQDYQDKQRLKIYHRQKSEIQSSYSRQKREVQQLHRVQSMDIQRRKRALEVIDQREFRSLETIFLKEHREKHRADFEHLPPITADLRRQIYAEGRGEEKGSLSTTFKKAVENTTPHRRSDEDGGDEEQSKIQSQESGFYKKRKQGRGRKR